MSDDGELGRALARMTFRDCAAAAKRGGARIYGRDRFRCLVPGCAGESSGGDVGMHMGTRDDGNRIVRMQCFKCGWKGTYVDLLVLVDGVDAKEACRSLLGDTRLTKRTAPAMVRNVGPTVAAVDDSKLKPAQVTVLWDKMQRSDELGQTYLTQRKLDADGLVRYVDEQHPDAKMSKCARGGYRVAMLLKDVLGQPTGIQMRRVGEHDDDRPKILSATGSKMTWFGQPERIADAAMIAVTEGMADTLAVHGWLDANGALSFTAVVGAPGKNRLPALAKDLREAGIDVAGKRFYLFVQNDDDHVSRAEFVKLRGALVRAGAHAKFANTPAEYEDVADWFAREEVRPAPATVIQMGDTRPEADTTQKSMSALRSLLVDEDVRRSVMGRRVAIRLNRMTGMVELGDEQLTDNHLTGIRMGLEDYTEAAGGKRFSWCHTDLQQVVDYVAAANGYHPVADWLGSLKWDGRGRSADFASALGVAEPLKATLLKRWLVGACARALTPGCKLDTVLILMGRQGIGKSTLFRTLAGPGWFCDSPIDMNNKDGTMVMRSAWIVEWAELDAMRKVNSNTVKSFLSSQEDRYRAPYTRNVQVIPRSCVIVGTTNDTDIIGDVTGSRRFWVVPVERIDMEWVAANREQLWAEATMMRRADEPYWLVSDEEAKLAESNADYETVNGDPWYGKVADYCRGRESVVCLDDILEALDLDTGKRDHFHAVRVGRIMTRLGWQRTRPRDVPGRQRAWCKPERQTTLAPPSPTADAQPPF